MVVTFAFRAFLTKNSLMAEVLLVEFFKWK